MSRLSVKIMRKYNPALVSTEIFHKFPVAAWYVLKEDKRFLLLVHGLDYYDTRSRD